MKTIYNSNFKFSFRRTSLLTFILAFVCTVSSYAQVSVTATAGTVGPTSYTTLGAALAAVNAGTHQGDITVAINANTAEGTVTAFLNASGAGTASYTSVLIQPTNDGVTVSGTGGTIKSLLVLNGADNVTIDGDNPNTSGTNRNLSFINTNTSSTTATAVIRLGSAASPALGINNVTIKNCIITGNTTAGALTTSTEFGIMAGLAANSSATAAPTSAPALTTGAGPYANITIQNNSITTCANAIWIGGSAAGVVTGLNINNNSIGSSTAANRVFSCGIQLNGCTSAVVNKNTLTGIIGAFTSSTTGSSATFPRGIDIASNGSANTISNNIINDVQNTTTSGYPARGISLYNGNNHLVYNNFVTGVKEYESGSSLTTYGAAAIYVAAGTGHTICFNSLSTRGAYLGGSSGAYTHALFCITSSSITGVTFKNNILDQEMTGSSSGTLCMWLPSGATSSMNFTSNNNAYFLTSSGSNTGFGVGTSLYATFAALKTYIATLSSSGTNDNASVSSTSAPSFVSDVNLHINTSGSNFVPLFHTGVPVSGITIDIDGTARHATTPDIGGHEFSLPDCAAPIVAGTAASSAGPAVCGTNSGVLTLTGTSPSPANGITIQWKSSSTSGGPYTNIAGANSSTFNTGAVTTSTYYVCVVTCAFGGSDQSNEVSVLVLPTPSPVPFSTPPGYCATGGGPVVLTAEAVDHTPAYSYLWSNSQTTYTVNENVTQTTTYTVTVTDVSSGCSVTKQLSVGVYTFPSSGIVATANPAGPSCAGTTTQLDIPGFSAEAFSVANITSNYALIPIPAGAGTGPTGDDVVGGPYSIGFNYNFFGNTYSNFYISTNGNIQFGPTTSTVYTPPGDIPATALPNNFVSLCFGDFLVGTGGNSGVIKYFVDGIAPNRILVVDYSNCGFYNAGTSNGAVSGQIRLYETTGIVEVHLTQSIGQGSLGGGVKCLGVENLAGTIGAAAPGRNVSNGAWQVTSPEAWRFTPPSTYSYAWTSSPSGMFSGPTNIGNPIGVVGAPGTTTAYTVVVTNSVSQCSHSYTVTVDALNPATPNGGTVSGPSTATCGDMVTFTSTGDANRQWQSSIDANTWTPISGQTGTSLTISTTTFGTGTVYFRTFSTEPLCGVLTAPSNAATLIINSPAAAAIGSISGPLTAACGDNVSYTASGVNGNIQWKISTDNITFIDVPGGTSSTLNASTNSTGPGTFYLKAVTTVSVCPPTTTAESNVLTVVVSPSSCSVTPASVNICAGTSTTLTASGNAPYHWSTGATTQSITVSPLATTTYTVTCGVPLTNVYTYAVNNPAYSTQTCPANTTTFGSLDDATSSTLPIGFTFNYFGIDYTQFGISTNGNIQLGDGSGTTNNPFYSTAFTPSTLPNTGTPNNIIAGIWTDLRLAAAEDITYGTVGSSPNSKLIVCWNAKHYNGTNPDVGIVQFQIVLNEGSNTIEINVVQDQNDATGDPLIHSEVMGVENATGTTGIMPPSRSLSSDWPMLSSESWNFLLVPPDAGCQCTSSATVNVTGPIVAATSSPSLSTCPAVAHTIAAAVTGNLNGVPTYSWSNSYSTSSFSDSPLATTTYTVTVSDGVCSYTASVTAPVYVGPTVTASSNNESGPVCTGSALNLTAASSYSPPPPTPAEINMQNGTFTTCSANFYDSGGPSSTYLNNNEDFTITFFPENVGAKIQVVFTSFDTENNYDGLLVYDGPNTSAPLISSGLPDGFNTTTAPAGSFYGSTSPGTILSSDAGGALTFRFRSDGSVLHAGWVASVSCIGGNPSPTSPFFWTGPNSFTSSDQNPTIGSVTTAATGSYTVTVTDNHGCTAASTTPVSISQAPAIVSLQSATLAGGVAQPFPTPPSFLDIPGFTTATSCDKVVNYTVNITGIPTPTTTYAFTGATTGSGNGTGTGSTFGRLIPTGRTTVTINATNVCGSPSKQFRVTITDNVAPVITPIQVSATNTNAGECASNVQVTQPSLSNGLFDNCPNATVVFAGRSDSRTQSEPYYAGTTTVTWQATDASGNTSIATQNVVVNNVKPVILTLTSSAGSVIFVNQSTTFTTTFTDEDGGGTHTVKFYRDKNDASPASIKTLAHVCYNSCTGISTYTVTSDPITYTTSEVAEPKVEVLDGCNQAADQDPGVTTFQYLAVAVAGTQFTTAGGHFTMPVGGYPSSYEGYDVSIGNVVKKATTGNSYKGQLEMNVHIPNNPVDWRVHTDNGTNQDITWDYLTVGGCTLATFKGAVRVNGNTGYKVLVQQADKTANPATSNFIRVKVTTNAGAVVFDTQPGLTEALTSGNGGAAAIICALTGGAVKVQPANGCVARIEDESADGLLQNIPNPFNGQTEIRFSVPEDGHYTLTVYNYLGQEVKTLFDADVATGSLNSVTFDGSNLDAGIYTYSLRSANTVETRRMNLMK